MITIPCPRARVTHLSLALRVSGRLRVTHSGIANWHSSWHFTRKREVGLNTFEWPILIRIEGVRGSNPLSSTQNRTHGGQRCQEGVMAWPGDFCRRAGVGLWFWLFLIAAGSVP